MTPFYPLLAYFFLCFIVFIIIRGEDIFKNHTSVIFFLFFMLLGYLNIFFTDFFLKEGTFYFRVNDFLSNEEITSSSFIYVFALLLTLISYFYFYNKQKPKIKIYESNKFWEYYSIKESPKVKNALIFTGISCLVLFFILRFGYYGYENAYAPARAASKEEIFEASYGRSQALAGIFLGIVMLLLFVSIELRYKWRSLFLFTLVSIMPVINASKAGFIISLFYVVIYMLLRKMIKFRYYYIFLLILLAIPSFMIGEFSRTAYQGWGAEGITSFSWFEGIVRRDTSLGQTLIMLSDHSFYEGLIQQYREAMLGLAVPSFIWPDKPNTPGYEIAKLFGFGVQSSAPGWLGGLLFVFGKSGIILGPIIVGYVLAFFSRHFSASETNISLKYPILFFILIQVSGWFMDGQYHSLLPNIIIILVQIVVILFFLLIVNFSITIPPTLDRIYKFFYPFK